MFSNDSDKMSFLSSIKKGHKHFPEYAKECLSAGPKGQFKRMHQRLYVKDSENSLNLFVEILVKNWNEWLLEKEMPKFVSPFRHDNDDDNGNYSDDNDSDENHSDDGSGDDDYYDGIDYDGVDLSGIDSSPGVMSAKTLRTAEKRSLVKEKNNRYIAQFLDSEAVRHDELFVTWYAENTKEEQVV